MMRVALILFSVTAGCTTLPAAEEIPVAGSEGGYRCNAAAVQDLVGQSSSQSLGADALRRSGSRGLRWIRPGDAVTMDYREDRLNIHLDARGRVERIACG